MPDRPPSREGTPSNLPLPTNKRSSMNLTSVLQHATNSINGSSSRSSSPVTNRPPSASGKAPGSGGKGRRQSQLVSGGSKKNSPVRDDDPAHLKAQITLLQDSLYASHQRIVQLTEDMSLDTSMTASPLSATHPGFRPWTPVNGGDISMNDMISPMTNTSGTVEEDVEGEMVAEEDAGQSTTLNGSLGQKILPKSKSNYDLKGDALTPGRYGLPQRKTSDGPGISRIPRASVAHVRLLHDASPGSSPVDPRVRRASGGLRSPYQATNGLQSPFAQGADPPHSPHSPMMSTDGRLSPVPNGVKKSPLSSAASTRVIDGLQTELINTKGHVEKLKQEMRSNQRLIGSLTRQTEDLKETKERMRVECEGLNNVVARKERLLQEVLDRARSAESSLSEHVSNKRSLEESTKKSISEMSTQLQEARSARMKADSEAASLKDSVRGLRSAWAREVKAVRDDMRKVEESSRKEREEASSKHNALLKLLKAQSAERTNVQTLAAEATQLSEAANMKFEAHLADLRAEVERTTRENKEANSTVAELAGELVRLRRMMREPRRISLEDAYRHDNNDEPKT